MNKWGHRVWRFFLFLGVCALAWIAYRVHFENIKYEVWHFLVWGFFVGLVGLMIKVEIAPMGYERLRSIEAKTRGPGAG